MMDSGVDSVVEALEGLAVAPPSGLAGKVFSSWLAAPSRIGEVFVALTGEGVNYLRTAESVHGDADTFAEAYRARFGRPLRPAGRAPSGLLPALRGRSAGSLELDLRGLSDFERDVLEATRRVPAGETRPYGWIAREAGRPRAVRAVGSVLGRNPVPLLVPCHRVVRADGRLGDYIFGIGHKEELLRAEHVNVDEVRALAGAGVHFLASDTTGVVCFPTCHHARRITRAHRHGFAKLATAVEAGYRPCRHCRPAPAPAEAR
jgi:methylated-DNA-[protein]-cysteine S-methyltransferase